MVQVGSANVFIDMLTKSFDKNDNWAYCEVNKVVNGDYEWKLPCVEMSKQTGLFLFEPSIALLYTSPRGSMLTLNHYCIRTELSFGTQLPGGYFGTLGLLTDYMWAGNSYNIPEGFQFGTNARIGVKW